MMQMPCIIVGAGMAGLAAATHLEQAQISTLILEKAKGVGGRMATRRIGEAVLDHGAQYFTVKTSHFHSLMDGYLGANVLQPWGTSEESRYIGAKGMTLLPKAMADGLNIRLNTRVIALEKKSLHWELVTDQGERFSAETVLVTAPLPQALALASPHCFHSQLDDLNFLESIQYLPCLAYLGVYRDKSRLPEPGGIALKDSVVSWMADNSLKGISPLTAMTLHATPEFSREYYEAPDSFVAEQLTSAVAKFLPQELLEFQIKRWRYSQPTHTFKELFWRADHCPPLLLAGDAFGGPRVEGAALSGLAAAGYLQEYIQQNETVFSC
jgi:predicted NAD/FAD-dependent oxidoreductase